MKIKDIYFRDGCLGRTGGSKSVNRITASAKIALDLGQDGAFVRVAEQGVPPYLVPVTALSMIVPDEAAREQQSGGRR